MIAVAEFLVERVVPPPDWKGRAVRETLECAAVVGDWIRGPFSVIIFEFVVIYV